MKKYGLSLVKLFISGFLTALAVKYCFIPHGLTPGGITGLSISVSLISGISIEIISLSISIPLLIIGMVCFGSSFGIKTVLIILVVPFILGILPTIQITYPILLSSIVGGVFVGIAIYLALVEKCSTGGTDIIALLIQKIIPTFSLPVILFLVDGIIVLSSWIISRNILLAVYSLIALLSIMVTIKMLSKRGIV